MHKNGYPWLHICDHVHGQKEMSPPRFCMKTEQYEWVVLVHRKQIITKMEKCKRPEIHRIVGKHNGCNSEDEER